MSAKEYLAIDERIKNIYLNVCVPCLRTHLNRCSECATMKTFKNLQDQKKAMETK